MRSLLGAILLSICASVASANEQKCLAEALYFEARDQGIVGMVAVGVVIQNRVDHPDYPDTVCGVVHQGRYWRGNPIKYQCQFTYWCDGRPERPTDEESWRIAKGIAFNLLMKEIKITGLEDATHYHADWVKPDWSMVLERKSKIGQHIFYAKKDGQ